MLSVLEPGQGNLDARAFVAALVGPRRIHAGQIRTLPVTVAQPRQILSNTQQAVAFVSASLAAGTAGPTLIQFSSGGGQAVDNAIPVQLENTQGAPSGRSFEAILLPGETLYAQLPMGAAATVRITTSTVWF